MTRVHRMPFGAELQKGATRFRLWAPGARQVALVLDDNDGSRQVSLSACEGGWYERVLEGVGAGVAYAYRIDERVTVPDPASRANPAGVHAPSVVVDPLAYRWRDGAWRGRPWHEAVVYELHIGAFTPAGTFAAAVERLDDLVDLGVTAVELMPVAAFPGTRNWGYDGVLAFAPTANYGAPEDLKRLVDEAHARGLMVLLDVVYNHFGPEGNYLHDYAPQFFNPRHATPWGAAINFDGQASGTVRDFFIHNALYWLEEFHFDGLRIDAVHAIADDSRPDFITELALRVRARFAASRSVHLVLENDRNQAGYLVRGAAGDPTLATAQWNDDLHHALHVIATGETDGYYADYAKRPVPALGRALAEGFVYQGENSDYRGGARRGERSDRLPPTAFVAFLQNHDQIGNRAFGERITVLADHELLRTLIACVLLAPQPPLLFMGEEFAASTPFLFFCDFARGLAAQVTRGRRDEFARFGRFRNASARRAIPDPVAPETFTASKLDWAEAMRAPGSQWRALYRQCLAVRRRHIVPLLAMLESSGAFRLEDGELLRVRWDARNLRLHLIANLGTQPRARVALPPGERIWLTEGMGEPVAEGRLPRYGAAWIVEKSP